MYVIALYVSAHHAYLNVVDLVELVQSSYFLAKIICICTWEDFFIDLVYPRHNSKPLILEQSNVVIALFNIILTGEALLLSNLKLFLDADEAILDCIEADALVEIITEIDSAVLDVNGLFLATFSGAAPNNIIYQKRTH